MLLAVIAAFGVVSRRAFQAAFLALFGHVKHLVYLPTISSDNKFALTNYAEWQDVEVLKPTKVIFPKFMPSPTLPISGPVFSTSVVWYLLVLAAMMSIGSAVLLLTRRISHSPSFTRQSVLSPDFITGIPMVLAGDMQTEKYLPSHLNTPFRNRMALSSMPVQHIFSTDQQLMQSTLVFAASFLHYYMRASSAVLPRAPLVGVLYTTLSPEHLHPTDAHVMYLLPLATRDVLEFALPVYSYSLRLTSGHAMAKAAQPEPGAMYYVCVLVIWSGRMCVGVEIVSYDDNTHGFINLVGVSWAGVRVGGWMQAVNASN